MDKEYTILVVEDDPINRRIINKILEDEYEVVEAENGAQALEILLNNKTKIDAVISDIMMPVMNGYELLKKMKENSMSELPVIVTTAYSDEASETKVLEAGAWDFVPKPYNASIIISRLKNAIARRQVEVYKRMQEIADHDSLTGIYNRNTMFEKTREMIDANENKKFAFIRLDIDHFSQYNVSFGEKEGDKLIAFFASCIEKSAKKIKLREYCRMNGDVFCLCIENNEDKYNITEEIEMIQEKLSDYKSDYLISLSAGVYLIDDVNLSIDEYYFRATKAAQQCKNQYDTNIAFFDINIGKAIEKQFEYSNDMQYALDNEQFVVYLQPKISLATDLADGAEALVRWIHPEKGMLYPSDFIPVFEKNGFVSKLDYYVWEHTCMILKEWIDLGKKVHPISVNISRISLYNPQLTELITELVEKYEIKRSLLQLEITESAYMSDQLLMQETIHKLRQAGFTILMDDFGSGYSSLNTLKNLEVNVLKIDTKFLPVGDEVDKGEIILSSIIKMAHWLGMSVVVEGVETRRQRDFLEGAGCDFVQGYYYSRPISIYEYEERYIEYAQMLEDYLEDYLPKHNVTILIVDDSKVDQEIIQGYFQDDYHIHCCDNAESALAYLKKNSNQVKLVLIDNIMPNMKGVEFLEFCSHDKALKIIPKIMITVSEAVDDQINAFKYGAYDYITKPLTKEVVIARVNHVMAISRKTSIFDVIDQNFDQFLERDADTGLLAKKAFNEIATHLIEDGKADKALLVIDVDDFKEINDQYGHLAGDRALRYIADGLSNVMHKTDIIGRFGGDEFVVLMTNVTNRKFVKQKAIELIKSVLLLSSQSLNINVSISIGLSFYEDDDTIDTLFARADQALYEAKNAGKNQAVVYGEKVPEIMDDEKPIVLICGDSPQLYSSIALAYGEAAAFASITSYDELVSSFKKYSKRITAACIDMQKSELKDSDEFYKYIVDNGGGNNIPIIAVCQEGNVEQLRRAVKLDVFDILYTPPQIDIIQRRLSNAIRYFGAESES